VLPVSSEPLNESIVSVRLTLTLYGELASKANSRKLVTFGGKPRFIKSDKALGWEQSALMQIPGDHRGHFPTGDIGIKVVIYYPTKKNDVDPSLLFDVLQKAGVIGNDRQIREYFARKEWDKENPRTEFTIYPLP
jgi:Holliday junction resolvase RusA-like endonuclease